MAACRDDGVAIDPFWCVLAVVEARLYTRTHAQKKRASERASERESERERESPRERKRHRGGTVGYTIDAQRCERCKHPTP